MADLEDLAGPASRNGVGDRAASTSGRAAADIGADAATGPKEMLTPPLRAALGKQGYKLVGALLIPSINKPPPPQMQSGDCVWKHM